MFVGRSKRSRFNLLLLSEGEHYFSDYSAIYYPECKTDEESYKRQVKGRLKVCSKSIIFDPQDITLPLIKCDFVSMEAIEPVRNSLISLLDSTDVFCVKTNVMIEMKENNKVAPYVFKKNHAVLQFAIKYVAQTAFLAEVNRLFAISRLPAHEADDIMKQIVLEREASTVFDMTWMENLNEKSLMELFAVKVTPLVINAGRLMLTQMNVYFQPINNVDANPVEKYPLKDVVRVVQRRHALRHVGLEIFWDDGNSGIQSCYFTFRTQSQRDAAYNTLTTQPGMTKLEHENQAQTTFRWQCGLISNYDYLMYLNSLAHRSFNDLAQYPVFPWVLADYSSPVLDLEDPRSFRDLSKPIGALNPDRIASLRKRYREMPNDGQRFLYGTHYSTPGYVLYYLVRKAPEYMLRLQNGKFDEPDRLFHNIEETWNNVLINSADLKELIPEFFVDGGFLNNEEGLYFGVRQDRSRINNVVLPAWASSADDFIRKHREALESEHVSLNINQWIDLIFGYKQRGEEALRADNLFHPLTYEGAVDLDKETDPMRRLAILMQISEFGQTPKQIFAEPHPRRFAKQERERMIASSTVSSPLSPVIMQAHSSSLASAGGSTRREDMYDSYSIMRDSVSSSSSSKSLVSPGFRRASSTSSSSYMLSNDGGYSDWGAAQFSSPISYVEPIPDNTFGRDVNRFEPLPGSLSFGSGTSSGRGSQSSSMVELPSISELNLDDAISLETENSFRISTPPPIMSSIVSWGGIERLTATDTLRSHREVVTSINLSQNNQIMYSVSQDSSLKIYNLTEGKQMRSMQIGQLALSSSAVTADGKCILIGSWDNNVYTYSIDYGRVQDVLNAHDDSVSCLALGNSTLISGSWDSTVKAWTLRPTGIERAPIASWASLDTEVRSVALDNSGNMVVAGATDGMVMLADLRTKQCVRTWHPHDDEVVSLRWTGDGRIVSAAKDGHLKVENQTGHELLAIQLADSLRCFATNGERLLLGGESGLLRVWDVLGGEEITQLSKKTQSPINCIATSADGTLVLTGSDDGSITKWTR